MTASGGTSVPAKPHFTARRGFIAAMGFGGVGLYALWVAYGAAPGPLALLGLDRGHDGEREGAGHGGHGAAAGGPTADDFRRMTAEFVARYRTPDGAVHPRLLPGATPSGVSAGKGRAALGPEVHDAHGAHPVETGRLSDVPGGLADGAVRDVYLLAEKWFYEPAYLRLDLGVPHRFHMMATDVSHGASIQFGRGGRMIRLRPGIAATQEMTFARPGNLLVYCTVYCGQGHDAMKARIEVVQPQETPS